MTDAELNEIEARANAASAGSWAAETLIVTPTLVRPADGSFPIAHCYAFNHAADGDFIANARSDVPKLLAEVRRLQEMLKAKIVAEFLPAIKQVDAAFEAEARRFMDRLSPPPPPAPHRT